MNFKYLCKAHKEDFHNYEFLHQELSDENFNMIKTEFPEMMDEWERELRWYDVATDEEIGEGGENLSSFLTAVYGGDREAIKEYFNNLREDEIIMYDNNNTETKNYKKHKSAIANLSITDLIKISDKITSLSMFIDKDNEVINDINEVVNSINNIIENCKTQYYCPHCGELLYVSDLPQYDYICANCDENFYECEVK